MSPSVGNKGQTKHHFNGRHLNCLRSVPQKFSRNFKNRLLLSTPNLDLEKGINLRTLKLCAPVRDQGQEGDCVGNATASGCEFLELQGIRENLPADKDPEEFIAGKFTKLSSQFPYWGAREIEGTTNSDSGCNPPDAANFIENYGICSDATWPNDPNLVTVQPTAEAYAEALGHKLPLSYALDQTEEALATCLMQKFPFLVGVPVYDNFDTQWTNNGGNIYLPTAYDNYEGGHCILIVGYVWKKYWVFQNSWGTDGGDEGFGTFQWEQLLDPNLAFDHLTLRNTPAAI